MVPDENDALPVEGDELTDDATLDEAAAHEFLTAVLDNESQQRLWIKAITPILQLRTHELDPSGRVRFAFDLMQIAACERVARILRSDLKIDQD